MIGALVAAGVLIVIIGVALTAFCLVKRKRRSQSAISSSGASLNTPTSSASGASLPSPKSEYGRFSPIDEPSAGGVPVSVYDVAPVMTGEYGAMKPVDRSSEYEDVTRPLQF